MKIKSILFSLVVIANTVIPAFQAVNAGVLAGKTMYCKYYEKESGVLTKVTTLNISGTECPAPGGTGSADIHPITLSHPYGNYVIVSSGDITTYRGQTAGMADCTVEVIGDPVGLN